MVFFGCKSVPFDPKQDIPPLNGNVILVTGGNIGLGKQCILEYARHRPELIWLAARNIEKGQTAAEKNRQQMRFLARKYPQFTCATIHPGVVRTNLMNSATGSPLVIRLLGKVTEWTVTPIEQGVHDQFWASVSKDVKSGEYYEPVGIWGPVSPLGEDDALAQKIWDWTEKELAKYVV